MFAINKNTRRPVVTVRLYVLDANGPRYDYINVEDYDGSERLPSLLDGGVDDEGNDCDEADFDYSQE